MTDVLDLVIIELGKAKRLLKEGRLEAKGNLEDWIKFFTAPYKVMEENKMDDLDERIKKAYEELQHLNADEVERDTAERRYMNLLSIRNLKEYEFNAGKEEGKKEGVKEGIKKGIKESQKEIAKKMKESDIPIEKIIEFTNLSKEEIEEL